MRHKLPNLVINVVDVLKSTTDTARLRAFLPIVKSDAVKREIGLRAIDMINARTESGRDKKGTPFKGYSKAYKESDTFKIYGKTNKVNLRLSSAMRSDIDVVKINPNSVEIGFTDSEQSAKGHGHVHGGGYKRSLPVRDFWGLPEQKEIESIIKSTIRDNEALAEIPDLTQAVEANQDVTFFDLFLGEA